MKFALCQISNQVINPPQGTIAEKFYDTWWAEKRKDGYWKPEHFWELPQWIAEIDYAIPPEHERELRIAEGPSDIYLFWSNDIDYYLFSVLDVNKHIIEDIVSRYPEEKFILGGYCRLSHDYDNVTWCDSVEEFCGLFGWRYQYGTSYKLFVGTECIPRLTLSTGCKHHCRFCTVPDEVVEKRMIEVCRQIDSFKSLRFKLVYVNDKTYGQVSNYNMLYAFAQRIKAYNPEFEGFIVQTTAAMVNKLPSYIWRQQHIKVVEIGVETYNDHLLKRYRKPVTTWMIYDAVNKLHKIGIEVIANLILGLPGETDWSYANTTIFCREAGLYGLNIYTLAAYADADLGIVVQDGDTNELHDDRLFWMDLERTEYRLWSKELYRLGIEIAKGKT